MKPDEYEVVYDGGIQAAVTPPPPSQPVAGWTVHLDASDTDHVFVNAGAPPSGTPTDGGPIEHWQSENAGTPRAWIQDGTTEVPTYRTTGLSGMGCVHFDGTTDYMRPTNSDTPTNFSLGSDVLSASAFTIIIAFSLESAATNVANIYDNDSIISDLEQNWGVHLKSNGGVHTVHAYVNDGATKEVNKQLAALQQAHVVQVRKDSSNLYISLDGGSESSVAAGNVASLAVQLASGLTYVPDVYAPIKVGEVLMYSTNLGAANDSYSYMQNKWL